MSLYLGGLILERIFAYAILGGLFSQFYGSLKCRPVSHLLTEDIRGRYFGHTTLHIGS